MSIARLTFCLLACLGSCHPASDSSPREPHGALVETRSPKASASALLLPAQPPSTGQPRQFSPETPVAFAGPNGSQVWLLERHSLPLVGLAIVIPSGSATDPPSSPGLAHVAARMLEEGAGDLDSPAFSRAMEDRGAQFMSVADRDQSALYVETSSARFREVLPLLADVVSRPRFRPADFRRVTGLWKNDLRGRTADPQQLVQAALPTILFGPGHPYGHPVDGFLFSSPSLADIQRFHARSWQPNQATLVVVGDIDAPTLQQQLRETFATWLRTPTSPSAPKPSVAPPLPGRTKTFIIDRSDAPQVLVAALKNGPPARDASLFHLELLNGILGGSFTSRLNQNLRETHGWTYGVRSRFVAERDGGFWFCRAAIRADALRDALHEMRREISQLAQTGPTELETEKARQQLQSEAVDSHATVRSLTWRLASLAAKNLPLDHEQRALRAQHSVSLPQLQAEATYWAIDANTQLLFIGPKQLITQALHQESLPPPVLLSDEGRLLGQAKP